jgi:hypothetical protein
VLEYAVRQVARDARVQGVRTRAIVYDIDEEASVLGQKIAPAASYRNAAFAGRLRELIGRVRGVSVADEQSGCG